MFKWINNTKYNWGFDLSSKVISYHVTNSSYDIIVALFLEFKLPWSSSTQESGY